MPKRSKSYNALLAEKLQNIKYARGYLIAGIEDEGDTVEIALFSTIRCMGIKEFCEKGDFPQSQVSNHLNGVRNVSRSQLDKYLAVFGLKTKLVLEKAA